MEWNGIEWNEREKAWWTREKVSQGRKVCLTKDWDVLLGCNEESKKDLIVLFSKQNGHDKFH